MPHGARPRRAYTARVPPIVGIPLTLDDRGRWRPGRDYLYIDRAYARAVESAGGHARHLPPAADAEAALAGIDALLIPGGDDFAPPSTRPYPPEVRFDLTSETQLAFDAALLAAALARGMPVLGICYGMQLLALHHGGTLDYHVPTDRPGAATHRLADPDARHLLRVEPDSRLAAILGGEGAPTAVNSWHHQAVCDPGEGLVVTARAEDGVVEGIEAPGERFVVGVQWHPEKLPEREGRPLFGALVAACDR